MKQSQQASVSVQNFTVFLNLSYSIPWIGKKAHFFSSLSAGYSNNKNKSLQTVTTTGNEIPDKEDNYSIENFKASLSLGKFLAGNSLLQEF